MDRMLRYLSGEVPGGFPALIGILIAILIFSWYLHRYSPVINKKRLRTITTGLVAFLLFSYVIARLARPPKPDIVNVAIFPMEMEWEGVDSLQKVRWMGTGWLLGEMISRVGEMTSPSHVMFVRPEWLSASFDGQTLFPFHDADRVGRFGRQFGFEATVNGIVHVRPDTIEAHCTIQDLRNGKTEEWKQSWAPAELPSALIPFAETVGKKTYTLIDEKPTKNLPDLRHYERPAALSYGAVRRLIADSAAVNALPIAEAAVRSDSASVLAWLALGYAHTELMILSDDESAQRYHLQRAEVYLKKSGQRDPEFQPVYSALTHLFMRVRPEGRYLDAEFAMIDGHQLYDRDYMTYYNLSFMNKLRWESLGMTREEQILERALEINPAGFKALLRLGQHFLEFSRPNDHLSQLALNHFVKAYKMRPRSREAILGLVTAYDHLNYFNDALTLLDSAQVNYPNDPEIFYSIGVIRFHLSGAYKAKKQTREEADELRKAEQAFLEAVRINNHAYSHLYLGKIYDYRNQRMEAIEAFRAVMSLLPQDDRFREEARKKLREYFPDVE